MGQQSTLQSRDPPTGFLLATNLGCLTLQEGIQYQAYSTLGTQWVHFRGGDASWEKKNTIGSQQIIIVSASVCVSVLGIDHMNRQNYCNNLILLRLSLAEGCAKPSLLIGTTPYRYSNFAWVASKSVSPEIFTDDPNLRMAWTWTSNFVCHSYVHSLRIGRNHMQ